jgi:hypothetical protein
MYYIIPYFKTQKAMIMAHTDIESSEALKFKV